MNDAIKAPLLLMGSVISFASMSTLAKLSGNEVPFIEVVFFRALFGLPLLAIFARYQRVSLKGSNRRLLLIRGVLGSIAMIMFFFAVTRIPVGNALLLNQMTPVFILPLAAVLLGEKVTRLHVLLTLIAIIGVGFVVKPTTMMVRLPSLVALGSALVMALAYITVHKLARAEHHLTIVFWFNGITLAMASPLCFPIFVQPSLITLLLLFCLAVFANLGQLFLTLGYKYGDAGKLAIIGSMGAVVGACFDYFIWAHVPDILTVVGGLLVIISCTLIQMLDAFPRTAHLRR